MGFPFIHAAIMLILIGGLIGSLYGVKGKVQIKEGEKASRFTVIPTGVAEQLPFEIAVDRFVLNRYSTGEPKEFRSDVRILVNGKEVLKDSILVNHPLTFQGISLYQSDYRLVSIKEVKFEIVDQFGEASEITVQPDAVAQLQGTQYQLRPISLNPGSTKRGVGVEINVQGPDGQTRVFKLFKNDPSPIKIDDLQLRFIDYIPLVRNRTASRVPSWKWSGMGGLYSAYIRISPDPFHKSSQHRSGVEDYQCGMRHRDFRA